MHLSSLLVRGLGLAALVGTSALTGCSSSAPGNLFETDPPSKDSGGADVTPPDGATGADGATLADSATLVDDAGLADGGATIRKDRVDTNAPGNVRAGDAIDAHCVFYDADGQEIAADDTAVMFSVEPAAAIENVDGKLIAKRAGTATIACSAPALGLVDTSPASIEIAPGDPAEVTTTLDRAAITAGESVAATCAVFDTYGNDVPTVQPTLAMQPSSEGATITDLSARLTLAGPFEIACVVPGAKSMAAPLEVKPGLPASLALSVDPAKQLYAKGATIAVTILVKDEFGNVTPGTVSLTSDPVASATPDGVHFRYDNEGVFVIHGTVAAPTSGGAPVTSSASLEVGGVGPAVNCENPTHGSFVNVAPGASVNFGGKVTDPNGVQTLTVNGAPVTPGPEDCSSRRYRRGSASTTPTSWRPTFTAPRVNVRARSCRTTLGSPKVRRGPRSRIPSSSLRSTMAREPGRPTRSTTCWRCRPTTLASRARCITSSSPRTQSNRAPAIRRRARSSVAPAGTGQPLSTRVFRCRGPTRW